MPSYSVTVLVLSLVIAILVSYVLASPRFKKWIEQKKANRLRLRAHSGKVLCEDGSCNSVATRITPNGYFCNDHWGENVKKKLKGGGSVAWDYPLNHTIRRS